MLAEHALSDKNCTLSVRLAGTGILGLDLDGGWKEKQQAYRPPANLAIDNR